MKKSGLIALLVTFAGVTIYGQVTLGRIQWGNNYPSANFRSLIYGPDPSDPTAAYVGQSPNTLELPTGTTVYQGPLLSGSGYTLAFFAGPMGSSANALTLYGSTSFRTGIAAGLNVGIPLADVSGVNARDRAAFQLRVWNNEGGTITDWAQAEAAWLNGSIDAAVTPLVLSDPLGGTDTNGNPVFPAVDSGWVSFNTYFIDPTLAPEPSSLVLTVTGAAALLIFRLRR